MPMGMRLLLTSLEAIECICSHSKAKLETSKKAAHKGKKGKKHPDTKCMARVPKKVRFRKHCNLCKKHGGMHTTHNTHDCCRFEKDRKEKPEFHPTKKGGNKVNPINQNLVQLTKKIKKLEKVLKKLSKKAQKR